MLIITLTFVWALGAEELIPEQIGEDKTVSNIVKEINKQIPLDTLVTSETIGTIGDRIEEIIIKAGYSKKEYSMQTLFCPMGHIHFIFIVDAKTRNGQYKIEAKYYFKKQTIKPKIDLKNTL